jgi:hypothetical protein
MLIRDGVVHQPVTFSTEPLVAVFSEWVPSMPVEILGFVHAA